MDEISIKVVVGNREYPLKINRVDEDRVRNAAQRVQDLIRDSEKQYPAGDKYDHLAMCALQLAGELVNLADKTSSERKQIDEKISEIESAISGHLATINVL